MGFIRQTYRRGINNWSAKFRYFASCCHKEFNRTTQIGSKMVSASKVNSDLHQNYKELGMQMARAYEAGLIEFPNGRCKELYSKIVEAERDLRDLEVEINKIKFSSGPELIRDDSDRPSIH